jgi:helix-turn-helix protein
MERSDSDGACYPSLSKIGEDCGLARSGAIRGVRELVDAGLIFRRRRLSAKGDLDTTLYILGFDSGGRPENESTGQAWVDGRPKGSSTGGPEAGSENPPNGTLPLNSTTAAASRRPARRDPTHEYSAAFEEAWGAYPKRDGDNPKKRALRAWNARLREGGTSPEEMIAGVRRYAVWVRQHGKEGTETVKQAATFFGPDCAFRESWSVDGKINATTPPVVTAADLQRELEEENRKAGYQAT